MEKIDVHTQLGDEAGREGGLCWAPLEERVLMEGDGVIRRRARLHTCVTAA